MKNHQKEMELPGQFHCLLVMFCNDCSKQKSSAALLLDSTVVKNHQKAMDNAGAVSLPFMMFHRQRSCDCSKQKSSAALIFYSDFERL